MVDTSAKVDKLQYNFIVVDYSLLKMVRCAIGASQKIMTSSAAVVTFIQHSFLIQSVRLGHWKECPKKSLGVS